MKFRITDITCQVRKNIVHQVSSRYIGFQAFPLWQIFKFGIGIKYQNIVCCIKCQIFSKTFLLLASFLSL